MKKNKLKLFGIIAAVAVIGLSLIGCGGDCVCVDANGRWDIDACRFNMSCERRHGPAYSCTC